MKRLHTILIFGIVFITTNVRAQESWSLDECVAHALTHNLNLKDLNYNTAANKESHRQSYRELFPTVSASSNYFVQYGRSVDPNNNEIVSNDFFSNNYSINGSIDIFNGFQKLNAIASTNFLHSATQQEALQEKYMLAFRVMTAFYDVQFFEGLLEISKEQVDISLANYNLVKKQIELGLKAASDLYEVESVLIADKLLVTQSKNNLSAAELRLIQEMNLENTTEIQINSLEEILLEEQAVSYLTVDSVYNQAITFMPIIQAKKLRVHAAKKDIAIARGNLYPSLSLLAGYGTGFFETNVDATGKVIPFKTQIKDNASQFVGLSLRIPISNRWSTRSQIKQQKIALLRSTNNLDIQKQTLNKVIQELVQGREASMEELQQTEQSEKARLLTFQIAQKKYKNGLISAVELYQSKNVYAKAQNENLQVKLKLRVQEKTLNFYMGLPIFSIKK